MNNPQSEAIKVITLNEWDTRYPFPEESLTNLKLYDKFSDPLYTDQDLEYQEKYESQSSPKKQKKQSNPSNLLDPNDPYQRNILESKVHLEKVREALDTIKRNAKDYEDNIIQIENIKNSVITKINEFYDESSRLIEQEKNLVDTVVNIQTTLQYYQDFNKLTRDVENLANNMNNIHIYAQNLQRFLSEIIDALEFFESKPKYKNSREFIEKYKKLKIQLLVVIKKMFVKILTEDDRTIMNKLESFTFNKLFPNIMNVNTNANSGSNIAISPNNVNGLKSNEEPIKRIIDININTELLKIIYPEYITYLSNDFNINLENTLKNRYINKILKNLLVYLKTLSNFDPDCSNLLKQLFHDFYGFSRGKIQELIVERIHDQIYNTQISQKTNLNIMLQKTIAISLQMTFFELSYHNNFFNNTVLLTDSSRIGEVLTGINELYHTYFRPYILKENGLEMLLECLDILNYYIEPDKIFIRQQSENIDNNHEDISNDSNILSPIQIEELRMRHLTESIFKYLLYPEPVKEILNHQKNLLEDDISNFSKFAKIYLEFLRAIRQDITNRMLIILYSYINDHIINYNINAYFKEISQTYALNQVTTSKNIQNKPSYFSPDMKQEILPLIKISIKLLGNLQNRIDDKHFQHIVNMVIGTTVNFIYLASEKFLEKIDSFLFLLKNLITFNQQLFKKNIEVNWSTEIQDPKNEMSFFDKLKSNFNFFSNVSKRVSSKLQEFETDLKMPLHVHIEKIAGVFIDDITFLISMRLKDYLKRYGYLEEELKKKEEMLNQKKINSEENKSTPNKDANNTTSDSQNNAIIIDKSLLEPSRKISNDGSPRSKASKSIELVKKDMATLFTVETVEKNYVMFTDNMKQYLSEIADKTNKYMEENCYNIIKEYIDAIIQNLIDLLHQFYILVSKEYPNESYNAFKFIDADKIKANLEEYFEFMNKTSSDIKI